MRKLLATAAALALVVAAAGCPAKEGPKKNPLDGKDPAQGFAATAFANTRSALDVAIAESIASDDRVLSSSDPLAIARLVGYVDEQRGCPTAPSCNVDPEPQGALFAFVANPQLFVPVADAHHTALRRWADLSIAHSAAGVANLLDQGGYLDDGHRANLTARANTLAQNAQSLETIDWETVAGGQLDPLLRAEITRHPPFPQPVAAASAAANAFTADLLTTLDELFGQKPIPALCCSKKIEALDSNSLAYAYLRRVPLMRRWMAADHTTWSGDVTTDLSLHANTGVSNGTTPASWAGFTAGIAPGIAHTALAREAIISSLSFDPTIPPVVHPPPGEYADPNADFHEPNTPNQAEVMPPSLTLTSTAYVRFEPVPLLPYVPGHISTPAPAPTATPAYDGASVYVPAGPKAIAWDLRHSAPIDHLDIRVRRYDGAADITHLIEVPDASGAFPRRTLFDPRVMDPGAPTPAAGTTEYVSYFVKAIAVDVRGRYSRTACVSMHFRFENGDTGTANDWFGETEPTTPTCEARRAESADVGWTPSDDTVVVSSFTYDGNELLRLYPLPVRLPLSPTSLTVVNETSAPVRLRSLYTPPYVEWLELPTLSIGSVAPLDIGPVPAGSSGTIALPGGLPSGTVWQLYDDAGRDYTDVQVP